MALRRARARHGVGSCKRRGVGVCVHFVMIGYLARKKNINGLARGEDVHRDENNVSSGDMRALGRGSRRGQWSWVARSKARPRLPS